MVYGQPGATGTVTMDSVRNPVHVVNQCTVAWIPAMVLILTQKWGQLMIASVLEVMNSSLFKLSESQYYLVIHIIPVVADAVWSDWSSWTGCTLACGSGTQQKNRVCSTAYNGGLNTCAGGADTMLQACNTHFCPGKQS